MWLTGTCGSLPIPSVTREQGTAYCQPGKAQNSKHGLYWMCIAFAPSSWKILSWTVIISTHLCACVQVYLVLCHFIPSVALLHLHHPQHTGPFHPHQVPGFALLWGARPACSPRSHIHQVWQPLTSPPFLYFHQFSQAWITAIHTCNPGALGGRITRVKNSRPDVYSPAGTSGLSAVFFIRNKAAVDICLQVPVCTCFLFSRIQAQECNCGVRSYLHILQKTAQLLFRDPEPLSVPTCDVWIIWVPHILASV